MNTVHAQHKRRHRRLILRRFRRFVCLPLGSRQRAKYRSWRAQDPLFEKVPIGFFSYAWLLVLFIDYIYLPRPFIQWVALRLLVVVAWNLAPLLYLKASFRRKFWIVPSSMIILFGICINIMVYIDTREISAYIIGLGFSHAMGIALFRIDGRSSIFIALVNFIGCVLAIMSKNVDFATGMALGVMLLFSNTFFILMSMIDMHSFMTETWSNVTLQERVALLTQEERLHRYFPSHMVARVRNNERKYEDYVIENAIVGFVDVAMSTAISFASSDEVEARLKDKFIDIFMVEAKKKEIVPLSFTGDGFMFVCNFFDDHDWLFRLTSFLENLHEDFERVVVGSGVSIPTGLKFGFAKGWIRVRHLGQDKAFYNSTGRVINLASKLCSKAEASSAIVSEELWKDMDGQIDGYDFSERLSLSIKGIGPDVKAAKILRRYRNPAHPRCPDCNSMMIIMVTEKINTDVRCPRCSVPLAA